jgi:hypothetical protein
MKLTRPILSIFSVCLLGLAAAFPQQASSPFTGASPLGFPAFLRP